MDSQIERYQQLIEVLESIKPQLDEQYRPAVDAVVSQLNTSISSLGKLRDSLTSAADKMATGNDPESSARADIQAKLDEARMKQSTLVARAQVAKTQKEFSTAMGTAVGNGAFAKFDKMEKKIEGMEAEAQAFSEVSGAAPADDPFAALEKNRQVDDELAKLMAKMGQGGGSGA